MFSKCKLFASFPFAIYYFFTNLTYISCFFTFLVFSVNLNVICARKHKINGKEKVPDYRERLPSCQPEGLERGGNRKVRQADNVPYDNSEIQEGL